MTINDTITSARPSNDVERTTGRQLPGVGLLSAEMIDRIQRHDLHYRNDCAWCVSLRRTGHNLSILAVPLHLTMHLPPASLPGLDIHYVGSSRQPGGVLVSLHHHDIAQVVGIASALGVTCTSARRQDPETVAVRFGGLEYLREGASVLWFARESDVEDILTLFPDLDIEDIR